MKSLGEYLDELRSLDQNNIGSWPTWAHGLAIGLVAAIIIAIAGWYFVLPKRDAVAEARQRETELRDTYRARAAQIANLDAYRAQLAQMNQAFSDLLSQLPSQTEVPSLLRDISQARAANGLDEQLFKPQPEVLRDFYAELPNDLIVTGDFHQFARFVSDVAALSRIVTIDDINIEPINAGRSGSDTAGGGQLRMSLTATTYRYRDAGQRDGDAAQGANTTPGQARS